MIFVRDKGRMCNNILQYAHVYAWGREHGRSTLSMRFAYKYHYFRICDSRHHHFLAYLVGKFGAKWGLLPVIGFHDPQADPAPLEAAMLRHRHVVVEGWWVPWHNLVLKYKQEIVGLFAFNEQVAVPVDAQLAALPQGALRLGVHVRRGDYRTWHDGKYYFTDEQYCACIRQFLSLHADRPVQVFVCGNDPELDKDFFRRELSSATVMFPEGNPGEDLYLLSCCHYLIGAPSTFTLIASMYHDVPLYWIQDANVPLTEAAFGHFDELFQHTL